MTEKLKPLSLPCLRGKMGDTFFYTTLMSFSEVAQRIKLPEEIDKKYQDENLKLGDWIQRKIEKSRINTIVDYLKTQKQHFFNSIIVGIFDGDPSWQDISVKNPLVDIIEEDTIEYLNRTFGILTLNGDESMFAIDGQHRAISIRSAIDADGSLAGDEIAVILLAHKSTEEGKQRTRRLFSTLNKYAKPVSQSEIIALSEDNNCAIITRELIENSPILKGKVLINKNRSISADNKGALTNVLVLYDLVERLLTNKNVYNIKVSGYDKNKYTTTRVSEAQLKSDAVKIEQSLSEIFFQIPSIKKFLKSGMVNRKLKNSSLLFRPIGQNILFDVYKVALEYSKEKKAIDYFRKDTFNLANTNWRAIFLDKETDTIISDKSHQKYATLLILEKIGVPVKRSKKDMEIYNNYKINPKSI